MLLASAGLAAPAGAQTYEVVHEFTGTNGDGLIPRGTLLRVGDQLYGTTQAGGDTTGLCNTGCGSVFRVDASGTVTTLHAFDAATEGIDPDAGLILASDGNFYGTTPSGGAAFDGTVYQIKPDGSYATIADFDRDTGGWFGSTPAIQGTDGNLYVVTTYGHCQDDSADCAQVLRMSTAGDPTPFHTFDPTTEGAVPLSPLLQTSPADFYGTTSGGNGAVYHLDAAGELTVVHPFDGGPGGRVPIGSLLLDSGNIYGVTAAGGDDEHGTIYRIDPQGNFVTLHSFDGTDGALPESGLIRAADGLFYGTTESGGALGFGTLYQMDVDGVVVKLHDFDGTANDLQRKRELPSGSMTPSAALVEGSDGALYGVRSQGGAGGFLFRWTIGPPAPLYCPNNFVRRDQMAVFLLKTEHGAGHVPPDCQSAFPDVPCPGLFADWIEELASEGITAGCGSGNYCPLSPVTREQMAVFLLKTEHGTGFTPPPCTGVFDDVPCSSPFAAWIEALASEGVTGGCGGNDFCPANPVTRAQMAVFLLKIEHGGSYVPPACAPLFADVACPSLFADWIEQLFTEGITAGCS
jgi:uncharacterized repeat protein (TIGR03803 family)